MEYKKSKEYTSDFRKKVQVFYESHCLSQAQVAQKFNISRYTLIKWIQAGEWKAKNNKDSVRAYYETHHISFRELSGMFNVTEATIKKWAKEGNWQEAKVFDKVEQEVLKDKITEKNIGLFLDTKKDEVKQSLRESLEGLDLDPIVLECIVETSSDELLLKAMNTAYIKKQILFCAIVARGELIKMLKLGSYEPKDMAAIIVAAEKVSKLFIDAGVSLFGKEQIQVREENSQQKDFTKLNMNELMALANANVEN
ncbi:hypothetical protein [Helicobacter cetorum]|nr:hypothetical protein [Helicobacter cetorum]AFI05212.1 hypothetical protein HCD_00900 [Helicobacter cetorum MIT 99-5656]